MSPMLATRILVLLSICYGIGVAILAALGSSALSTVAHIGALALGALWAVRGLLFGRDGSG
jgi:hypothetical protein